jgi:hypothetical protein
MSDIKLIPMANGDYEFKKDENSYYIDKEVFYLIDSLSDQLSKREDLERQLKEARGKIDIYKGNLELAIMGLP